MPQITWKSVGDLDFSDSNDLRVKGSEMMVNGAKTIVDVFKEVATKNAVVQKEDRDLKFAGAIQSMSLAQDEGQLRSAYGTALNVEGIGADNVLKLTDTFKGYQKGILNLQGQRLDITGKGISNTGQGLVNTSRQQGINYTSNTQPLKIQSDNAVNKGVVDTINGKVAATNSGNVLKINQNTYKGSQIQADTKAGLPFLTAQRNASKASTGINQDNYKNKELQANTEAELPYLTAQSNASDATTNTTVNSQTKRKITAENVAGLVELDVKRKASGANTTIDKDAYDRRVIEAKVAAGVPLSDAETKVIKNSASQSSSGVSQAKDEAYTKSELAKLEAEGKASDINTKIGENKFTKLQTDTATNAGLVKKKVDQTIDDINTKKSDNAYKREVVKTSTDSKIPELSAKASAEKSRTALKQSLYTSKEIGLNDKAGITQSGINAKLSDNELRVKQNKTKAAIAKRDKTIVDNTASTDTHTAITTARNKLVEATVASVNVAKNAQLSQKSNQAKLTSEISKYTSLDDNYYSNKRAAETNKLRDQEELRVLKKQAEKDKSKAAIAKYEEVQSTIKRRQTVSNTVSETMIAASANKTLDATTLYGKALKSLKKNGIKLTVAESIPMFDHFAKLIKADGRKVSTLKGSASSFSSKDNTTKTYYENLNSSDSSVVDIVMSSLQASGAVIDGGIARRISPKYHKDYMKGLIEFMSKHTDEFSPVTFNSTNAAEGYAAYNRQYFNKTVNETDNPIKIGE